MSINPYLIDFYNTYDEDRRLALKHGSVEFLTTMRYINKYIRPGHRVLEIGAGTGRYSHALARQGYSVDAVELVQHNMDVFREKTLPEENITIRQGNALDLSAFPDDKYDITLLLGPLYHLYSKEDKEQAIREAIRVTKKGGVIFAAYVISDGCLLDEGFHRGNISVADYVREGLLDSETFAAKSEPKDLFELVRKEDIDELMSIFPVTRLHYVATDGCALFMREAVDTMDEETFQLYLKYHFATCEREDLAGVTAMPLIFFRSKKVFKEMEQDYRRIKMAFLYKRATIEDLDILTETRIEILRAANQLSQDVDMTEVEEQSYEYYKRALYDGSHTAYLVFEENDFVGAGGISFFQVMPTYHNPTGRKAYIMNMYTRPEYRRKGIAYKTLDLLVKEAKDRGITAISLEATAMGRPLYEKYGFVNMAHEMELPM